INNVKEVRVPQMVVSSSSRLYSCVACTKTMHGLYDSLCNIACVLLSPCCLDDYSLYSVILPVHHVHCLNSCNQLCLTLILSSGCLTGPVVSLAGIRVMMIPKEVVFHRLLLWLKF